MPLIPLNIQSPQNQPIDVVMPSFPAGIANQAAQQILSAEFPPSWDFWHFRFLLANITLAMIAQFEIFINNVQRVRITGAQWDAMNKLYKVPAYTGSASTTAVLGFFFRRMALKGGAFALGPGSQANSQPILYSGSAKDLGLMASLNCGSATLDNNGNPTGPSIGAVKVQFTLVNTDATHTPAISCIAQASAPTPGGPGLVRSILYQSPVVASGSPFVTSKGNLNFGQPQFQFLNAVHLFPASGTLDNFVVRHNGIQKRIRQSVENDFEINKDFLNASQSGSGFYSMLFQENTFGDEQLAIGDIGTDLQVQFTASATGAVDIIEDSSGAL